MKQGLKLSEKLFCLSVNPASGGVFMGAASVLGMTLSGSVLVELMNKGLISIDNGVVHLLNPSYQNDEIHEYFMGPIRLRKKDRKVGTWISWFNGRAGKIQKMYIRHLVRKNVLRLEEKRFLFIPYQKVYLMDRPLVESVSNEVKHTLLGKTEPTERAVILAMMAAKTNLLSRIIPDKAERKIAASNLKKLPETPVSKAVKEVIQMMHTTVMIATS
jgi:hypothetical protein